MKKEEKEQTGQFLPVFGVVYNIDQPEELQKASEKANAEYELAKAAYRQANLYLERCKRLVTCLQVEINNRKEVNHV